MGCCLLPVGANFPCPLNSDREGEREVVEARGNEVVPILWQSNVTSVNRLHDRERLSIHRSSNEPENREKAAYTIHRSVKVPAWGFRISLSLFKFFFSLGLVAIGRRAAAATEIFRPSGPQANSSRSNRLGLGTISILKSQAYMRVSIVSATFLKIGTHLFFL